MTEYEAKRFISIILMIFGVATMITGFFQMFGILIFVVPTALILGVLALMFGYQLNQEATLDLLEEGEGKKPD
jgi:hypothetical protein